MDAASVRAFVFDVFGTLVDWRSGVSREAAPFLARFGQTSTKAAEAGAFADAWRRRYSPAMEAVRSGRRPFVPLDVLHRENLDDLLPEFGIDPAGVPAGVLDQLNLCWHRLDPWPDVVPGLLRLKPRFIIAPLSNGNVSLLIDLARRAGMPWDAILGAEVVRAYKPMPDAYLRAVEMLGLRPPEVCLVAAHESDLAAARSCGLQTCFMPRPQEHGPDAPSQRQTGARDLGTWDLVVSDCNALACSLGV